MSNHIIPITDSYDVLKKKYLYDTHSKLEFVQLMIKLFNIDIKENDPLALSYEIESIMHDVNTTGIHIDVPLTSFFKAIYPKYSHYFESIQTSMQLKNITFDFLLEKFL